MPHARQQHPNAVLTPTGRRRMVACVVEDGWSVEAAAERFQIDAKTVRKWRDRFLAEGVDGLLDRTIAHTGPRTRPGRRCSDALSSSVGDIAGALGTSVTSSGWPHRRAGDPASPGPRPVDRGDRATNLRPAAPLPTRPAWRAGLRRRQEDSGIPTEAAGASTGGQAPAVKRSPVGYRCIHSAIDHRTVSPTPRSTTTNKASPPPPSGAGPTPGSPPTASPSSEP